MSMIHPQVNKAFTKSQVIGDDQHFQRRNKDLFPLYVKPLVDALGCYTFLELAKLHLSCISVAVCIRPIFRVLPDRPVVGGTAEREEDAR